MASMKKLIPLLALLLAACDPTYNWRDYQIKDAPFSAQFPSKPATHTRSVDLDGIRVEMTMTAAEVEGALFAVGSATLGDAAKAPAAIEAMKTAMVRNINGTVTADARSSAGADHVARIQAHGTRNGQPIRMAARFEAHGVRIYQVVAIGPERALSTENVDQFMNSFKAQ
jgi:hypothetical protein